MYIDVDKLQVGMRLNENIYREEQLVMSQGMVVNNRHIEMLERLSLKRVRIISDVEAIEKKRFQVDLTKRYQTSVAKFREICNLATIGQLVIYDQVKDCIDPLLNDLENNPELALKIWQIESADFYTYEHSVKVCLLSVLFAKWLNKPQVYLDEIGRTGLLHDIGKCNIPNEILNKPDVLSGDEFRVMKTHATLGYVLLSATKELNGNILKGILHHHESFDGQGYPAGLVGKDIPEYSRLVSVVDVFDAMTSNRIYREKMNPFKVLEIMAKSAGISLDPQMTKLFIHHVKQFYIGEKVLLNNGKVAQVIGINEVVSRPLIELEGEMIDLSFHTELEIESLI